MPNLTVFRPQTQATEDLSYLCWCIIGLVKASHFRYTVSLLALVLLIGVVTDQSICFSCPADLPGQSASYDADTEVAPEFTCCICSSSLTGASTRPSSSLLAEVTVVSLVEKPYRLLIADSIYHPPKH